MSKFTDLTSSLHEFPMLNPVTNNQTGVNQLMHTESSQSQFTNRTIFQETVNERGANDSGMNWLNEEFDKDHSAELATIPKFKTIDLTFNSDNETEIKSVSSADNVDDNENKTQGQINKQLEIDDFRESPRTLSPKFTFSSLTKSPNSEQSITNNKNKSPTPFPSVKSQEKENFNDFSFIDSVCSILPFNFLDNMEMSSFNTEDISVQMIKLTKYLNETNLCCSGDSESDLNGESISPVDTHSKHQNSDNHSNGRQSSDNNDSLIDSFTRLGSRNTKEYMVDDNKSDKVNYSINQDDGKASYITPLYQTKSRQTFVDNDYENKSDSVRSAEERSEEKEEKDDNLDHFIADDDTVEYEMDSVSSESDGNSVISIQSDYDPEEPLIYNSDPKDPLIKLFAKFKPNSALQPITPLELQQMQLAVTPKNLKVELLNHQVRGIDWMMAQELSEHRGGILADDMGLGKTLQTICLILNHRPARKEPKPTLVVVPVSLLNQWQKEIRLKIIESSDHKNLSIFVHHGATKAKSSDILQQYDIVLTSYGLISSEFALKTQTRKNNKVRSEARIRTDHGPLHKATYCRVVLDEAQYIKNMKAKVSKGCCNLKTKYRWCLSGTPLQNNIQEAYSLIKFLRIKPFDNIKLFRKFFITWNSDKIQCGMGLKHLHLVLQSIMLRRTKTSKVLGKPLLELPPRNVHLLKVQFTPFEREAYDALANNCISKFYKLLEKKEVQSHFTYVLVLLLRMRQACDHLKLVQDSIQSSAYDDLDEWNENSIIIQEKVDKELGLARKPDLIITSAKIEALIAKLIEIEEDNPTGKVIIFSQFTKMLDIIEPQLKTHNIKFTRLDGTMKPHERQLAIDTLQKSPETRVMLISLRAGSVGLNLNFANYVFLMDVWWNPMVEEQAIDRVHRIGQKNAVHVFRLAVENTIEDKIIELQERKRLLAHGALSGKLTDIQVQKLNEKDLMFLFGN